MNTTKKYGVIAIAAALSIVFSIVSMYTALSALAVTPA